MGYPSMGSWVTYGLGSESENLPAYVVMPQPEGTPEGGTPCWGAGFLPAVYQGTVFRSGANPILNLQAAATSMTPQRQRRHARLPAEDERDGHARRRHRDGRADQFVRAGVPDAEPRAGSGGSLEGNRRQPASMYGLDQKHTDEFGTRCLLARRLVERGVRFVQLYSGGGPVSMQWDAHKDLVGNHEKMCGMTDQPVAGLLKDLKQRGLLDSTLVIWGAEFGRLPMSQGGDGRDHNPHGVHDVVRRRRREARHDRRRDRRDGTARGRRAVPDARLPRDDSAPAGPGSESALVPAQRPQREADRLRRERSSRKCWRKLARRDREFVLHFSFFESGVAFAAGFRELEQGGRESFARFDERLQRFPNDRVKNRNRALAESFSASRFLCRDFGRVCSPYCSRRPWNVHVHTGSMLAAMLEIPGAVCGFRRA